MRSCVVLGKIGLESVSQRAQNVGLTIGVNYSSGGGQS